MNRQSTRHIVPLATVIGFVLLTCGSALAQDVKYNYAMGTNFAKYKTYRWVDIPNQNHPDQIADQQIRTAIEEIGCQVVEELPASSEVGRDAENRQTRRSS